MAWRLTKIISGGQTGIDQLALRVARDLGYVTGGTAPKGYRTEDGACPELGTTYGLTEHPSADYLPRTKANAKAADLTVWFGATTTAGYQATRKAALVLLVNPSAAALRRWVAEFGAQTLNVAGNRASHLRPEMAAQAEAVLREALRQ